MRRVDVQSVVLKEASYLRGGMGFRKPPVVLRSSGDTSHQVGRIGGVRGVPAVVRD